MSSQKMPTASNKEWRKWGASDPLYGVASWAGKSKDGADPWTDEDFYRLGELDWTDFHRHWQRYGVDTTSCLEIGCGAGRITKFLAGTFERVHALDVSDSMIAYARERVPSNVEFHLATGTDIPLEGSAVSAVFSCHVFQHFDSLSVARQYFHEIARVLAPGGSLMIHLPIFDWPFESRLLRRLYRIRKAADDIEARVKRALMERNLVQPIMRTLRYPLQFFYDELPACGLTEIEVSVFATSSNGAAHPFVLARKQPVSRAP